MEQSNMNRIGFLTMFGALRSKPVRETVLICRSKSVRTLSDFSRCWAEDKILMEPLENHHFVHGDIENESTIRPKTLKIGATMVTHGSPSHFFPNCWSLFKQISGTSHMLPKTAQCKYTARVVAASVDTETWLIFEASGRDSMRPAGAPARQTRLQEFSWSPFTSSKKRCFFDFLWFFVYEKATLRVCFRILRFSSGWSQTVRILGHQREQVIFQQSQTFRNRMKWESFRHFPPGQCGAGGLGPRHSVGRTGNTGFRPSPVPENQ